MDDASPGTKLMTSLQTRSSRRGFLKGAVATGGAVAGMGLLKETAGAQAADSIQTILDVAATAETLAVTFYTNGVNNAASLGLSGNDLDEIKAALLEEEIHLEFFLANGGKPAAQTFSFPAGTATFTSLSSFISTQQQLEGVFDSAFIAAAYEFGQLGRADLTRYACMIAMIESEHRALGRDIARSNNVSLNAAMAGTTATDPADNWAFAPQVITSVGAAPALVQAAGYLSPTGTNTFTYAKPDVTSATYASVYAEILYKAPSIAM